jgi:hypothetical protein
MASASAPIARPAAPKGWLATLGVLVVMLGMVGAGLVAAVGLSSVPDKPVTVVDGVNVVVPPDWSYVGRGDEGKTIELTRGNATVDVSVVEDSDETAALKHVRADWAKRFPSVSMGEIAAVADLRTDSKPAARFAYSGTLPGEGLPGAVEGEVTAVRGSNSVAVVFDAWADQGAFATASDAIARIIRETTIP